MGSDLPEPLGSQKAGRYNFITPDECRSEKVHRLLGYWNQIRGGRHMPRRQDIDPTLIWHLLKNIMLTEWHSDPDRLFYRISGTEVVSALGIELGGKWVSEVYPDGEDVDRTIRLYRAVADARAPILGRTDGTQMRVGTSSYEWVICPLSEDGAQVTHFIGLEDYVARRPYLGAPS
ncbi:PAS domain-containing protein [Dongia sp. agr-C8]